jgi:hypothetical protein
MTIEGVLTKAVNYYTIENNNQMRSEVVKRGRDLMDKLSLRSNTTLTTPMLDSVKSIDMIRVFLSTALSTIVFFLAILSVQLIYSLMLSDVEEKTY